MTTFNWNESDDWLALWWAMAELGLFNERRMRLFAVAACRRIADRMIEPGSLRAIAVAEAFADGLATDEERLSAHAASREGSYQEYPPRTPAVQWAAARAASWLCHDEVWKSIRAVEESPAVDGYEAMIAAGFLGPNEPPDVNAVSRHAGERNGCPTPDWGLAWQHTVFTEAERKTGKPLAALLRDIFGNPFRAVAFLPAWRTDTAVSLARGMYESRDFSAMPILADALQDAGCEDEQVLHHCRDATAPHVRGCWVCDLVLNRS